MGESELGSYVKITNGIYASRSDIWDIITLSRMGADKGDMTAVRELLREPINIEGLEIINEDDLMKENEDGN